MSDDELYRDWQTSIEVVHGDLRSVGWDRNLFEKLQSVVRKNERLQNEAGHYLNWIRSSYIVSACMVIRRQTDHEPGRSLRHVLYELAARPSVLNRARYRTTWRGPYAENLDMCDLMFDGFNPIRSSEGADFDHVDGVAARSDVDGLVGEAAALKEFIEQTYAHSPHNRRVDTPNMKQLNDVIDHLETVFKRYYALLTLKSLVSITPTAQYDELDCFTFPWIPSR
jgi:hypothetical protein